MASQKIIVSKSKRSAYSKLIQLKWYATDTDLMEIITPVWKLGIVRESSGASVTKKVVIKAFECLFNIKLNHYEVKQSKAINSRKQVAPFLNKLLTCLVELSQSKL